ncbi:hypothetical protein GF322_04115 [Candidatus Dependentiae bacterium]|nr:hypothetical protein [Candidatus Dependentiae bacterium]
MSSYEFIPHVADVRLKIKAKEINNLFTAALIGMSNLLKSDGCSNFDNLENSKIVKDTIEISSIDLTTLLIDFLSEVLTHSHVNKSIYCKVKFDKLTDNFLVATIWGRKIDSFDEDIKAVTYHEADISKDNQGDLSTIIIFDI